jgi:hypothetical protein
MDLMSHLFKLTDNQKHQLSLLKASALKADKGTSHFYEFSACPVIGLYLISGDLEQDGSNNREIEMKLVSQPDYYPVHNGYQQLLKDAYGDYVQKKLTQFAADQSKGVYIHNLANYQTEFESVLKVFDREVKEYHGIMCFDDGNVENDDFDNVFFLHICDVINIYANKMIGQKTKLLLKTVMLPTIEDRMCDILFQKKLTGKVLETFKYQMDMFYYTYCYNGNRSFIPVRTHVARDSKIFVKSKFFMNDNHFVRHQNGKLHTINHVHGDRMAKVAYRSV